VAAAFGAVERAALGVVGAVVRLGRDPVGVLQGREGRGSWPGPTASTSLRVSLGAGVALVVLVTLVVFVRLLV
jgi:hypothetical protein